jgi:hypothetical protein
MKNLMLEKMMKPIHNLTKYFYPLLLCKIFALSDIRIQIAIIAILEYEIVVVCGLLHIVQLDDVMALAAL